MLSQVHKIYRLEEVVFFASCFASDTQNEHPLKPSWSASNSCSEQSPGIWGQARISICKLFKAASSFPGSIATIDTQPCGWVCTLHVLFCLSWFYGLLNKLKFNHKAGSPTVWVTQNQRKKTQPVKCVNSTNSLIFWKKLMYVDFLQKNSSASGFQKGGQE